MHSCMLSLHIFCIQICHISYSLFAFTFFALAHRTHLSCSLLTTYSDIPSLSMGSWYFGRNFNTPTGSDFICLFEQDMALSLTRTESSEIFLLAFWNLLHWISEDLVHGFPHVHQWKGRCHWLPLCDESCRICSAHSVNCVSSAFGHIVITICDLWESSSVISTSCIIYKAIADVVVWLVR
jgi:hypothetical protein